MQFRSILESIIYLPHSNVSQPVVKKCKKEHNCSYDDALIFAKT